VWIETSAASGDIQKLSSRLMQACGLKLTGVSSVTITPTSRLMQACGLKHSIQYTIIFIVYVTPHAGVWIETKFNAYKGLAGSSSRLMQACGLKPWLAFCCNVASESRLMQACGLKQDDNVKVVTEAVVTPHAGVWIETISFLGLLCLNITSRLMQACGLKHLRL